MNKETHKMLSRLESLGISQEDALSLRRISTVLHNWHTLECGDSSDYGSWCITRGHKYGQVFDHDDDGKPFLEHHHYHRIGLNIRDYTTYTRIPDRETGAKKRLEKIMSRYPELVPYIQTDPRGCSLYVIPKDKLDNRDASCYYSSIGTAVYK
jgi:hypothetical protein